MWKFLCSILTVLVDNGKLLHNYMDVRMQGRKEVDWPVTIQRIRMVGADREGRRNAFLSRMS